jgi:cytochrome c oxidase assembly factor CtaG
MRRAGRQHCSTLCIAAGANLAAAALSRPAWAHGGAGDLLVASTWTYDPWVVAPLYLSAGLYLVGTRRLWRRAGMGRGVHPWQAVCFWAGWLACAAALVSPLHWLGDRLFSAHMIEHGVLMVVAAPLVAISRPYGAMMWALPARWRRLGALRADSYAMRLWLILSHPVNATLLHGFAIWAWHLPYLYEAALSRPTVHRLQHLSFFMTALLFWWSMFYGARRERTPALALLCLFVTSLHTGALGLVIGLANRLWIPGQSANAAAWGLTPLEDQQLGGLIMWVPGGASYLVAALALVALWIRHSGASAAKGGAHAAATP